MGGSLGLDAVVTDRSVGGLADHGGRCRTPPVNALAADVRGVRAGEARTQVGCAPHRTDRPDALATPSASILGD